MRGTAFGETAMGPSEQAPWRVLAGASVGNLCEIYDFAIFGFSIPILSLHFFPGTDRTAALLSTFAVFAVAFFARPLGGLMFGIMADRVGRIAVMSRSIWLMAGGTVVIGLLPTYAAIGVTAPILLVACRFAQGLAMGGETTGNSSFTIESAPDDRRGGWIGWTWFFGYSANGLAALFLLGLQLAGGDEAYAAWIWRVPFVLGGAIGLMGFWLRRRLEDPDEFKEGMRARADGNPLRAVLRSGLISIISVILIGSVLAVGAILLNAFLYAFLLRETHLSASVALLSNAAANLLMAVIMPIAGSLSDRLGRRPVLFAGALWVALFTYASLRLAISGSFMAALLGQSVIAIGVGIYGGVAFTTMVELFPTSFRATGHAIGYQLGTVLFGGTAPFIAAWLSVSYGPLAPGAYLSGVAVLSFLVIYLIPETQGVSLRTSVSAPS